MVRLDDVRVVRWFDGVLQIEGETGVMHSASVPVDELLFVGLRVRPGLRYLAARFPAGSTAIVERRDGRTALAVSTRKAG